MSHSVLEIHQSLVLDNILRDGTGKFIGVAFHNPLHDFSDRLLIKPFGFGVDGHDPLEIERVILDMIGYLHVWVMDFPLMLEEPHLSGYDNAPPLFEPVLEVFLAAVKPFQGEGPRPVSYDCFEHPFPIPLIENGSRQQYVGQYRLHLPHLNLRDLLDDPSVLISPG